MTFQVYDNANSLLVTVGGDETLMTIADMKTEYKLLARVMSEAGTRRKALLAEATSRALVQKAQQKVDNLSVDERIALKIALGMPL